MHRLFLKDFLKILKIFKHIVVTEIIHFILRVEDGIHIRIENIKKSIITPIQTSIFTPTRTRIIKQFLFVEIWKYLLLKLRKKLYRIQAWLCVYQRTRVCYT